MKTAAIIAEYNPFHNGHAYHIEQTRKITGADEILVLMSGDFVQRGSCAFMPKHLRAEAALRAGASAVLELPAVISVSSAEGFARGAVHILNQLNCVDFLCFGTECETLATLTEVADLLSDPDSSSLEALRANLRAGLSYPVALDLALADYHDILSRPNNILALEYLKALRSTDSKIIPFAVLRTGTGHHDLKPDKMYASASALRALADDYSRIEPYIPDVCRPIIKKSYQIKWPMHPDDFSLPLRLKLLRETPESLAEYEDISCDLANKIYKYRNRFLYFEQFCLLLKTKDITYTHISRAMIHILLDIKKDPAGKKVWEDINCIRVLGFRKSSQSLLGSLVKDSRIPVFTKLPDDDTIQKKNFKSLVQDIYAGELFGSVLSHRYQVPYIPERSKSIIKV